MTQYCSNCGSQASLDSVFCEQCGSKLPGFSSKVPTDISFSNKRMNSPSRFYSSPHRHSSIRRPMIFGVGAVFLIVVLSGALFVALIANDTSYEYLGGTFAVYEKDIYQDMAEAEFIIDNAVGTVSIDFVENNSESLVIIELQVYGPSQSSIGDSNMFEVQELGNRSLFVFNSWNPYTDDKFNYDIIIYVSTLLKASFDVQVITGEIIFYAEGVNIIEEISLETTTGSIYARFEDTYFPIKNTINRLKTVTGTIDTQFNNIISESDLFWSLETVSGSIYSHLDQFNLPEKNVTYYLDLVAVTGEINYFFDINDSLSIGYFLNSKVVTGQTVLNGFSSSIDLPYYTPNFQITTLNLVSTFETTTGSITISKS